jgi:anti-sigma factor RsiW
MTCREFRRRYSAYRDGHDPVLAAEMDDHLEVCPDCAAYDRAIREGVDALRGGRLTPSPGFKERLAARLASGEEVPEPVPPRVSPVAASIAAALFLSLLILTALNDLMVTPRPAAAEAPPLVVAEPRLLAGLPFVTFQHVQPKVGGSPDGEARP